MESNSELVVVTLYFSVFAESGRTHVKTDLTAVLPLLTYICTYTHTHLLYELWMSVYVYACGYAPASVYGYDMCM